MGYEFVVRTSRSSLLQCDNKDDDRSILRFRVSTGDLLCYHCTESVLMYYLQTTSKCRPRVSSTLARFVCGQLTLKTNGAPSSLPDDLERLDDTHTLHGLLPSQSCYLRAQRCSTFERVSASRELRILNNGKLL